MVFTASLTTGFNQLYVDRCLFIYMAFVVAFHTDFGNGFVRDWLYFGLNPTGCNLLAVVGMLGYGGKRAFKQLF